MSATLSQIINMTLQVAMLLLLSGAYIAFRKRKFVPHAQMMTFAWAINITSFLLVMIPSLVSGASMLLMPPIIFFNVVSIVHIPIGAAALILSTFLVLRWTANANRIGGCRGKYLMRATMVTWLTSILIGASIFITMPS